MPHLHMSFQAGDDMVLKRMKRRHSRAEAVATVARLKAKRPGLAIGADLIAGFPTESDEMHENSLRLVDECDIVMGHIFPFSPKQGTPAARMPQVPPPVVQRARAPAARGLRAAQGGLAARAGGDAHSACWSSRTGWATPRISRRSASPRCGSWRPASGRRFNDARETRIGERGLSMPALDGRHAGRSARVSEILVRPPARRLPQDLRPARRQSHRAVHQVGARRRDARRDRGGAGRLRSRPARPPPRIRDAARRASGSSAASARKRSARSSRRRWRRSSRRSPKPLEITPFRARR